MNEKQADILKATAAAKAAHERLGGTVGALKARLDRKTVSRRVQKRLARTGSGVVDTARANPVAAVTLAVIALLFVRRARKGRAQAAAKPAIPLSSARS